MHSGNFLHTGMPKGMGQIAPFKDRPDAGPEEQALQMALGDSEYQAWLQRAAPYIQGPMGGGVQKPTP
jgi:hypothetical protein